MIFEGGESATLNSVLFKHIKLEMKDAPVYYFNPYRPTDFGCGT
jgi:hypothetical protein